VQHSKLLADKFAASDRRQNRARLRGDELVLPAGVIDRLSKEIGAGVADSGIRARIAELGDTPFATPPSEFAKLVADDTEKWACHSRGRDQGGVDESSGPCN
jgi:hypothetical protein